MPAFTCSATAAGVLPSITQAIVGDGFAGSCGATNTAPSGLSAAVTRSAENGISTGALTVSGPDVDTGGRLDAVAVTTVVLVVVVLGAVVALPWCVVVVSLACGVAG